MSFVLVIISGIHGIQAPPAGHTHNGPYSEIYQQCVFINGPFTPRGLQHVPVNSPYLPRVVTKNAYTTLLVLFFQQLQEFIGRHAISAKLIKALILYVGQNCSQKFT